MNDNQKEVFENVSMTVGIVTVILSFIVWFIFIVQAGVDKQRLKHETCMVITSTNNQTGVVTITEYCGPNNKEPDS